ncbi:MAG: hypothetical protein AAF824_07705 [Bacteroidota bacterium]
MKLRLLFLGVIILMSKPAVFAQTEIDVTKLLADPKVFIFSDQKNTVKEYIYGQISAKTSCCGSDRIYLEVKIDPSGHVLQVKTLTGKNDCFKKSAVDIVKNVKWDAEGFKGAKSVYFEIKPDVSCEGDRSNAYAAIPVFNNPLLDDGGVLKNNTVQTTSTVVTPKEEPAATMPAPEPVKETVAEVKEEAEKVEPAVKETVAATTEVASEMVGETKEVVEQEAEKVVEATPVTTTVEPTPAPVPETTPVVMASNEEPTPTVDGTELALLREKMDELRLQEEEDLEKQKKRQAYIERRRRAREARRQRILEQREASASAEAEDDPFYDDEELGDDGDPNRNRDETLRDRELDEMSRFRDEVGRLEERRREIDDQQRRLEEEQRRTVEERQRIAQERVRVEEDIRRVEEESAQRQEEYELQRLEEDLRRREEEKLQQEQEIQRMLAEIERLQREQDRRMEDLQKQEQDIQALSDSKTLREQQIEADRLRRQKENEAAIKMMELQADLNSVRPTDQIAPLTPSIGLNEAMTTENDSQRLLILINEISLLQEEIRQMQMNLYNIQQSGGTLPAGAAPSRGNATQFTAPPGSKNANDDNSWKKVDYKDPAVPDESYKSEEEEESPSASAAEGVPVTDAYDPVRGYSPDPSHKDTHANVAGPKFSLPDFGEGEGAMKNFIKNKLREGGVCGLAQAFAEVTVDPSGTVIGYNVLKTNNTMVALRLPSVLRSLTFSPTDSRVPQNLYVEFKADILCGEGDQSDIDLKEVDSFIKSEN